MTLLTQSPSASPVRNPGIDLLRGVSILLVILNHIGLRIRLVEGVLAGLLPSQFLNEINFNGYEAVFLFFVISGFLITSHTLARWGRLGSIDARAFYARRAARILPCLLALVAVLSLLHLGGVHDYVISEPGQSLPRAVISALGLHLNWYEGHTGYLPASWDVLWSLSIEEVFYLAFPLVCLVLRKNWLLVPSLCILAASLPVSLASIVGNPIWREKSYLPGMSAIAVGVLAALLAARLTPAHRFVPRAFLVFGLAGVVAVLGFEQQLWPWLRYGVILLLAASAACLILAFQWHTVRVRGWTIPATGWLRSLGRMSYEIYLTHMFVVLTVAELYKRFGGGPRWGLLWYPPALAGAWALGWLVARYFSEPAERMLRRRLFKTAPRELPQPVV